MPAPEGATFVVNVDGLDYVNQLEDLVYPRPDTNNADYIADDERRIYYAGDYCSYRNPGFEAATLSGMDLAQHILGQIKASETSPPWNHPDSSVDSRNL
jgi:hypothetical protein